MFLSFLSLPRRLTYPRYKYRRVVILYRGTCEFSIFRLFKVLAPPLGEIDSFDLTLTKRTVIKKKERKKERKKNLSDSNFVYYQNEKPK